ncbi:hypothetical protein [Opitutus sp. ER46]|uniref:hypothetical protein n=1 Tax=Opitutus sp. ER46 TaxID=2161864 RepID=UPI000D31D33C|nr:hypothetical protein [Opitutus sp. ER46]PTX94379.1 hypothetical protein DB354_11535 [Opitutus sp. ER46]
MNIRERIDAFWSGERPDQIPYTIYWNEWRHTCKDPGWQPLYDLGLGVTWYLRSFEMRMRGVETDDRTWEEGGKTLRRLTRKTPIGEVYTTFENGWRQKYFLETPEDYRVMAYIVEHTDILPAYAAYQAQADALPPYGIAIPELWRTPLQQIQVDLAGLENFSFHLIELEEEVRLLYAALLKQFRQISEVVAKGPGRYLSNLENFMANTLGPKRYAEFHVPVYEECFPILHAAGKLIGCHYDGQLAVCRDLIAQAPIDLIESLTPPPEGDLTLAEARAAWPNKLFWSNINVGCYELPEAQLRELVLKRAAEAAPDGRRLAFEVSEQYPENWRTSMAVVLKALQETRH